ncbi:DUF1003 domain-containing protein [Sphingomonas sp. CA1-15]|uniref:DUF1003 domain-containing protein n=2 Tax=Sphingomonas immobilis TaxID=3063997 RepID=A0ABT8ZVX9_9SPHN|nr:DUF1003 domain-containing protein [Sphingomonas sp. CA1-15]
MARSATMADDTPKKHVDETIEALAAIYEAHNAEAGLLQRLADRFTGVLGQPVATGIILAMILAWMAGNVVLAHIGVPAPDAFPFPSLEISTTIAALLVALLILTTQRHEDVLAEKRARLTLQIAVLSEKKIAKVIELLEDQRRDNPLLSSRLDAEANSMANATDPQANLAKLDETEDRKGT